MQDTGVEVKIPQAYCYDIASPDGKIRPIFRHQPGSWTEWRVGSMFSKEPETIALIDTLKADDIFYDIGANIGIFSVYAGLRAGCRVYAFEPEVNNFNELVVNIRANHLESIVTPICVALTNEISMRDLTLTYTSAGGANNNFGCESKDPTQPRPVAIQGGCLGFPLDSLRDMFTLPQPTFIKIDVDGLELEILKGAASTLSNPLLTKAIVEGEWRSPPTDTPWIGGSQAVVLLILEMQKRGMKFKESGKNQFRSANLIFERR